MPRTKESKQENTEKEHPEETALRRVLCAPLEELYADRIILPPIPAGRPVQMVYQKQQRAYQNMAARQSLEGMGEAYPTAMECPLISAWLAQFLLGYVDKSAGGEKEDTMADAWSRALRTEKPRRHRRDFSVPTSSVETLNLEVNPLPLVVSFEMACYPNGDLKPPLFRRLLGNSGIGEGTSQEPGVIHTYPDLTVQDAEAILTQSKNTKWEWALIVPDPPMGDMEPYVYDPLLEPILGFLGQHDEVLRTGVVWSWSEFRISARDTCPCMMETNVCLPLLLHESIPPVVGTEAVHTFLCAFLLASAVVAHHRLEEFAFLRGGSK